MAYITKEYLENNIKSYDQYRNLNKEGQANGLATLDANGKVPTSQLPSGIGGVTYGGNEVSSIVQGTNTSMSFNNGALTIAVTNGGGGTIPVATSSTTGGVIVSNGGSKTFNYTWSGTDEAPTTTSGTREATVYKPATNGKYYPVECTTDGTATVKIPNTPNPYWDNSQTPTNNISVEIDRGSSGTYCNSITITCPLDALYAELTYNPMSESSTVYNGNPVTISKIQIDQKRNGRGNTRISFTLDSSSQAVPRATSTNTYRFMSLKFATSFHTYLATLKFASRSDTTECSILS